jgi:Putative zinc-finger
MMLDCKQSSQLISQSLDRPLTLRERFSLKLHLLMCKYCQRFSQHLQTLRVAVNAVVDNIENNDSIKMPSSAKNRITELVESHRQQP